MKLTRVERGIRFRPALVLVLFVFLIFPGNSPAQGPPKQSGAAAPAVPSTEKTPPEAPEPSEKIVTELRIVPYQKLQKPDNTMPKGTVKILQKGRQGRERVTYLIKMTDGRPVERTVLGTEVLSAPTAHVELIGTAPVVSERTLSELQPVPFQKEQKSDDSLPAGTVKVLQEGREGQERMTYRVKTVDGTETERVVIGSEILSAPVNRVEAVGTGRKLQELPDPSSPGPRKEEK